MMTLVQPGTRQMTNLAPLTEKQLRDSERDAVYLFNVAPREQRIWAVGRQWVIPGCPKGEVVSEPMKVPGIFWKTDVRKLSPTLIPEMEWIGTDGTDVVKRILGQDAFQHESADLVKMGCFAYPDLDPPAQVIEAATKQWLDRCDERVQAADQVYSVNNGMVLAENGKMIYGISKDDVEAADILGIERPWATKNRKLTLCDECGTGNLPTAAFCKSCDNMLNAEAAQRKFPSKYAERMGVVSEVIDPQRRGPGRPRRDEVGL